MIPTLLVGSFSIAIVALAQGAGIRPAFPNPDGSRASASRDFLGQGLGNIAGAFFQSAPSGGSLSRTAVSADGGASRRVAGYLAAATVLLLVVLFGAVVGQIPEAVIGGLLFVIGVELVLGRMPDARIAWRAGRRSMVLLVITLVLTLTIPLQWAIICGAFLSLAAFVVASGTEGGLLRLVSQDDDWVESTDIPEKLPADEPVMLRYSGPNFFADVPIVIDQLPQPVSGSPGVLVLELSGLDDFSSTVLKGIGHYQAKLAAHGSGLILAGVNERARASLDRTGLVTQLGPDNVLAADPHLFAALRTAHERGLSLQARLRSAQPERSSSDG